MNTYAREQAVDIDDVLAATEAHYRATVEGEIVAWLRRKRDTCVMRGSEVLMDAIIADIEAGEHRAAEARTTPRG
jgi:hypothetical protein